MALERLAPRQGNDNRGDSRMNQPLDNYIQELKGIVQTRNQAIFIAEAEIKTLHGVISKLETMQDKALEYVRLL